MNHDDSRIDSPLVLTTVQDTKINITEASTSVEYEASGLKSTPANDVAWLPSLPH